MLKNIKIGFIGAGTMGKAIIKGLIETGFSQNNIFVSEKNEEIKEKISTELKINLVSNNKNLVENADIVILCVKPFVIKDVLEEIKENLTEKHIIVSIAAGINTEFIENCINKQIPVIRVMPNTPAVVKEGMTAICKGKYTKEEQINLVKEIFSKIGKCIEIQEKYINIVTGISGSGPAFIYLIIEALAEGGVKLGLPKETAIELAAQTTLGAAKMVLETGKHPSILKKEVATPGGCTEVGLIVMEESDIREILSETVKETARKASELCV